MAGRGDEEEQQLLLSTEDRHALVVPAPSSVASGGGVISVAVQRSRGRQSIYSCGDGEDAPAWYELYDADAMPLLLHGRLRDDVYADTLDGLHDLYRRYIKVYVWVVGLATSSGCLGALVLTSVLLNLDSPIRIFLACLAITFILIAIVWGCLNPQQYKKQKQAYLDQANAEQYHRIGLHLSFERRAGQDEELVIDVRPEYYGTLQHDNSSDWSAASVVIKPSAYLDNPPHLIV